MVYKDNLQSKTIRTKSTKSGRSNLAALDVSRRRSGRYKTKKDGGSQRISGRRRTKKFFFQLAGHVSSFRLRRKQRAPPDQMGPSSSPSGASECSATHAVQERQVRERHHGICDASQAAIHSHASDVRHRRFSHVRAKEIPAQQVKAEHLIRACGQPVLRCRQPYSSHWRYTSKIETQVKYEEHRSFSEGKSEQSKLKTDSVEQDEDIPVTPPRRPTKYAASSPVPRHIRDAYELVDASGGWRPKSQNCS